LQSALISYNDRNYDHAQAIFEDLRERDPYSLDHIDTFSNILYVKNEEASLSFLAHDSIKIEKYCPETCCVVGNYYSLKNQHEKAISYFQQALRLDPCYLSAWTLMGHEYVELRNAPAAIAAYRRAVEINPKDYRAWYGLGQTYEIQQLHSFSLYYFKKATDLRPHDARMWCALGDTYSKLGRIELSIKCFLNARSREDREGVSVSKLAKLYHSDLNDLSKAEQYYLEMLQLGLDEDEELASGLIALAQMYKDQSQYSKAEAYCNRVLSLGGTGGFGTGASKDQARCLLKEVMSLRSELEFEDGSEGSDMDQD
jgi:anaphase-promoting complex subunit 8